MATICLDPQALGVELPQVVTIVGEVLSDPAFPVILDLVNQISAMNSAEPTNPAPGQPYLNLNDFVLPLKTFIFVKQHWVVTMFLAVGLVAVPFALGYAAGRP